MSSYRQKIAIVTGTRADYGILRPVIQAIAKHQSTDPTLIVCGMHLQPEFGMTIREIERDAFPVGSRVDMLVGGDSPAAMAKSLGLGIISITQALCDVDPALTVVLGDRGEMLAATLASAHLNIPIAHLHGGECTTGGNIDESIRWSISRFAHVHCVATQASGDRLIAAGEDPGRVHRVGAPALDVALSAPPISIDELGQTLGMNVTEPTIIVIQHPVTTEPELAASQMRETMEAVAGSDLKVAVIYPNADAGGKAMIRVIEEYRQAENVHIFPSLPHQVFLNLMRHAVVMVGNSSCALIEAPSFGLPAINVGQRQAGRERGVNVIDVDHDRSEIGKALLVALNDRELRRRIKQSTNPYGDGQAAIRIADVVARAVSMPGILKKGTFQHEQQRRRERA